MFLLQREGFYTSHFIISDSKNGLPAGKAKSGNREAGGYGSGSFFLKQLGRAADGVSGKGIALNRSAEPIPEKGNALGRSAKCVSEKGIAFGRAARPVPEKGIAFGRSAEANPEKKIAFGRFILK